MVNLVLGTHARAVYRTTNVLAERATSEAASARDGAARVQVGEILKATPRLSMDDDSRYLFDVNGFLVLRSVLSRDELHTLNTVRLRPPSHQGLTIPT